MQNGRIPAGETAEISRKFSFFVGFNAKKQRSRFGESLPCFSDCTHRLSFFYARVQGQCDISITMQPRERRRGSLFN